MGFLEGRARLIRAICRDPHLVEGDLIEFGGMGPFVLEELAPRKLVFLGLVEVAVPCQTLETLVPHYVVGLLRQSSGEEVAGLGRDLQVLEAGEDAHAVRLARRRLQTALAVPTQHRLLLFLRFRL